MDKTGRIGPGAWIRRGHIVELLTERASDAYLAYLQNIGVSYLSCGTGTLRCTQAAEKLFEYFNIQTALLQGGGAANGSFAAAGRIDELSLVVAPSLEGGKAVCLMESVHSLPPVPICSAGYRPCPAAGCGCGTV